eukprot:gnl/Spiro4/3344_TR1631_c0_g1_i1.p2 gnl/Spiro4/3344_TR1631_c0_g1~~gnl/Spiro4/3344_TR1631_c0_g1_i1.p2  ORF type:complete len:414 (-),score=88.71 gnl/Spiro4/3344_TR1631_c0_g1_i1:56-1216(-)
MLGVRRLVGELAHSLRIRVSAFSARHVVTANPDAPPVRPPTRKQLVRHFIAAMVPMIGFGFMDNTVMIQAGDFVDNTLGVKLGIGTLTAAACGQCCSDFAGVCFGGVVAAMASKLGLPPSGMDAAQLGLRRVKFITTLGMAVGVLCGCGLGMVGLLFMDLEKSARLKKQKELTVLFRSMCDHPRDLLGIETVNLWVVEGDTIWSKLRTSKTVLTREKVAEVFKLLDSDGSERISVHELMSGLERIGWAVSKEQVLRIVKKYDKSKCGALNFDDFFEFVTTMMAQDEIVVRLKKGTLREEVISSGEPLNVMDPQNDIRFDSSEDKYRGSVTRQIMLYPIVETGTKRVIGLIEFINKTNASHFDENDLRVMSVLAHHAGLFLMEVTRS